MTILHDIQHIFSEINTHLLEDEKPSSYFNKISETESIQQYPLSMLSKLKSTEQSPKYHPEGNVWNHTMLVVDQAAIVKEKSNNPTVFMWAALLHDIGKPDTTKIRKGRITSYDHDKVGAKLSKEFLKEFTDDYTFIDAVAELIRWHMQILFVVNNLPFADVKSMKSKVDINEVALLGLCDRMGRTHANLEEEVENIKKFIEKCNRY